MELPSDWSENKKKLNRNDLEWIETEGYPWFGIVTYSISTNNELTLFLASYINNDNDINKKEKNGELDKIQKNKYQIYTNGIIYIKEKKYDTFYHQCDKNNKGDECDEKNYFRHGI